MAKLRNWASGGNFAVLRDGADDAVRAFRRRRIAVFAVVFIAAFAAGLATLFTLPVEYRAAARVQIAPATVAPPANAPVSLFADPVSKSFSTEIQVLTSRPVLEKVAADLAKSGQLPADLGPDPAGALQRMVGSETVDNTDIVRLRADGPRPEFLPVLVNAVIDAYQDRLANSYKILAANADSYLGEEVRVLDGKVKAKRSEVDAFQARHDIVSLERDDNQVLSRLKGLGAALNEANDRAATAEGHLKALRESDTGGRAKDDPKIAGMEERAADMRDKLTELGRKYTAQYLDLDPDVKALRARLTDLEEQIAKERVSGRNEAIADAQQELSGARETAVRLKRQLDDDKQSAVEFTARLGEYKALQDDLGQLEELHRGALERLAKLEARERESAPRMTVLELAAQPREPRSPLYALDAGMGFLGALVLAFLAVRFVEFFAPRPEPAPAGRESWGAPPTALDWMPAAAPLIAQDAPRLAVGHAPPRELTGPELAALLRAAAGDGRLALAGLLSGLSLREVTLLRWTDMDLGGGAVAVPGDSPRTLPLAEPLGRLLAERHAARPDAAATILHNDGGGPLTEAELDGLVMVAAYDAALDRADEVTAAIVRHTYIVFLLRQGVRLADIGRIVGNIPRDELLAHMRLGATDGRAPLDRIERIPPALRSLDDAE